jgi:hypothetical protein
VAVEVGNAAVLGNWSVGKPVTGSLKRRTR